MVWEIVDWMNLFRRKSPSIKEEITEETTLGPISFGYMVPIKVVEVSTILESVYQIGNAL